MTLRQLGEIKTPHGALDMRGTSLPSLGKPFGKPIRRKLHVRDGEIVGCNYTSSYGWMSAWDGKPKAYSEYA